MGDVAFWDVDTQNDYMLRQGKMYVKGAEKIRPALRKLYAFARKGKIPVLASCDANSPTDAKMKDWPEHCIRGTEGQRKIPETALPKTVILPDARKSAIPDLQGGTQVVLEKTHHDPFSNPSARELVETSGLGHWVVFGVATDYGIRLAALGLLKLGKKVTVVSDAVHGVSPDSARQAVIEMQAAGADFRTAAAVIRGFRPAPRRKTRTK